MFLCMNEKKPPKSARERRDEDLKDWLNGQGGLFFGGCVIALVLYCIYLWIF